MQELESLNNKVGIRDLLTALAFYQPTLEADLYDPAVRVCDIQIGAQIPIL